MTDRTEAVLNRIDATLNAAANESADLHRKLDRILDLLTERRNPTVKQQVDDLIERYERGIISGPEAYKRLTQVRLRVAQD